MAVYNGGFLANKNGGSFQTNKTNNVATLLPGLKDKTLTGSIGGQNTRIPVLGGTSTGVKPQTPIKPSSTTAGSNLGGGNAYASLLTQMESQAAAERQRQEDLARQKQEAAQAAYDKNMGYLNSAYSNRAESQKRAYQDALAQLEGQYNSGAGKVNQGADEAQQQAYINYRLQQRDLPQALMAQGITGGAAESTLADMANSYGNNRNTVDKQRNSNLGDLLDTLNTNKSNALQSYNNTLSDDEARKMAYQMELENALANQSADILTGKYDALSKVDSDYGSQVAALQQAAAKAAMKNYTTIGNDIVNTAQSAAEIRKTGLYTRMKNMLDNRVSVDDVIDDLGSAGLDSTAIQNYLAAYGL